MTRIRLVLACLALAVLVGAAAQRAPVVPGSRAQTIVAFDLEDYVGRR